MRAKLKKIVIGLLTGSTSHVVTLGQKVWKDVGVAVIVTILTAPAIGLWGLQKIINVV